MDGLTLRPALLVQLKGVDLKVVSSHPEK